MRTTGEKRFAPVKLSHTMFGVWLPSAGQTEHCKAQSNPEVFSSVTLVSGAGGNHKPKFKCSINTENKHLPAPQQNTKNPGVFPSGGQNQSRNHKLCLKNETKATAETRNYSRIKKKIKLQEIRILPGVIILRE